MALDLVDQVYNDLIDLPSSEKALLAYLAHKAHKDGTSIYPGIESMMKATSHQRWQTNNLLRKLKEKGYVQEVVHGGGARHFTSYRIPLDAAGTISPVPLAPDLLAEQKEQRASRRRKSKKTAAELVDQAQPAEVPASSPEPEPVAAPPVLAPAAAALIVLPSTLVPVPMTPAPVIVASSPEPEPVPENFFEQEEQRLRERVEMFRHQQQAATSPRQREIFQRFINQAQAKLEEFLFTVYESPPGASTPQWEGGYA